MIYSTEMIAIFARNYSQLVVGVAGIGIYIGGQVVVADGGPPFAFLLVAELGFAITGEVAKLNERLVAGLQPSTPSKSMASTSPSQSGVSIGEHFSHIA